MTRKAETTWSWKAWLFVPFMVLVPLATYACDGASTPPVDPDGSTAPAVKDQRHPPRHLSVQKVAEREAASGGQEARLRRGRSSA